VVFEIASWESEKELYQLGRTRGGGEMGQINDPTHEGHVERGLNRKTKITSQGNETWRLRHVGRGFFGGGGQGRLKPKKGVDVII